MVQAFNGKKWEKFNSEKVASLAYARIQGKAALVTHFQNSSLMNEDKRCRPILFHSEGQETGDEVICLSYLCCLMDNDIGFFSPILKYYLTVDCAESFKNAQVNDITYSGLFISLFFSFLFPPVFKILIGIAAMS